MKSNAQVLLYNLKTDERGIKIGRWLTKNRISAHVVSAPEFLHPLGFLFEIPGFLPNPQFNLGGNFKEEMLVMKDFSEVQMDAFLKFFRENRLAPIELKAVLTPITMHWSSLKLHEELQREHKAMQ